jgi:putative membrane protein
MMWDGNGYGGHGAGWEGWVMLMFMIVFVVALVVAIVFLVRYLGQSSGGANAPAAVAPPTPVAASGAAAPESPKDILKRRYAAGEIDREEYLQKLGDL